MIANGQGEVRTLLSQHGLGRIRGAVNALGGRMPALTSVPAEAGALRAALLQIRDTLTAGSLDEARALVDQLLAPAVAIDEAYEAMERAVREAREAVAGVELPATAQDVEGATTLEEMSEAALLASGALADVAARASAYAKLIGSS
jgi:hypothetical protein